MKYGDRGILFCMSDLCCRVLSEFVVLPFLYFSWSFFKHQVLKLTFHRKKTQLGRPIYNTNKTCTAKIQETYVSYDRGQGTIVQFKNILTDIKPF